MEFTDLITERAARLWSHEGIECAVLRAPPGVRAFSGYVQIAESHPWRRYETFREIPADVHGGLTFGPRPAADPRRSWEENAGWIGFDTLHHGDLLLDGPLAPLRSNKTQEWVEAEVERLAEQVAGAAR